MQCVRRVGRIKAAVCIMHRIKAALRPVFAVVEEKIKISASGVRILFFARSTPPCVEHRRGEGKKCVRQAMRRRTIFFGLPLYEHS